MTNYENNENNLLVTGLVIFTKQDLNISMSTLQTTTTSVIENCVWLVHLLTKQKNPILDLIIYLQWNESKFFQKDNFYPIKQDQI